MRQRKDKMALPSNFKQDGQKSQYTMNSLDDKGTRIRFVSDFITGKFVWGDGEDGKRIPHHYKKGQNIFVGDIGTNKFTGEPESIKQFIAGVVWNYRTEQFEIFETNKSTVIGQIVEYEANDEYGDSKGYDLTLKKTGEKMDTKYSVIASPPKPVDSGIVEAYKKTSINLQALFDGKDPFNSETEPVEQSTNKEDQDQFVRDVEESVNETISSKKMNF